MSGFDTGTKVEWEWGQGTATGTIVEIFTDRVTKTLKGTEVTREASSDEPAYLIEQDDGDEVLKSHTEVTRV